MVRNLFRSILASLNRPYAVSGKSPAARLLRARPRLEHLEAREVPAIITVTTENNDGPGSLREAISDSNSDPFADTIVFAEGVEVITLTTPLPVIGYTTDIIGPEEGGVAITRASWADPFRILHYLGGTRECLLRNIVLDNGVAYNAGPGGPYGGGIYAYCHLTLENCVVSACSAEFDGGGIYAMVSLQVSDTIFLGNYAGHNGGGICYISSPAPLDVVDCLFDSNNAGGGGAGIYYNAIGHLNVVDCVFDSNESVGNGGGIWFQGYVLNVIDGFFVNNVAGTIDNGSAGGGIFANVDWSLNVQTIVAGNFAGTPGTNDMLALVRPWTGVYVDFESFGALPPDYTIIIW